MALIIRLEYQMSPQEILTDGRLANGVRKADPQASELFRVSSRRTVRASPTRSAARLLLPTSIPAQTEPSSNCPCRPANSVAASSRLSAAACDQESQGDAARRSQQQSNRRSQIDSQTSRANRDRRTKDPERALGPLMADEGEAALQGERDGQETMCQKIGNGEGGSD